MSRVRVLRWLGALAVASLALAVAGGAFAGHSAASCGKVVINENAWAGSTANVYVAKYVLEKRLGCKVEITKIAEIPVFQALADGKVDAVLEDWQHVDQYAQYINKRKTVAFGGHLGVVGHIGWYTPKYVIDKYPAFKNWTGLKGREDVFKSPESGSQGMFLGGDPSYVQKDKELIRALGLNFKHVSVGAEPAQVARWTQLYRQKRPVIFYWYTPQFLNQQYDLVEVKLPPRFKGCKDDAKSGGKLSLYRCAYDITIIEKIFSAKFAKSGSPAVKVLRNFKWTNADQEFVAKLIAGDHVAPEKAAERWVKGHPGVVKKWLG